MSWHGPTASRGGADMKPEKIRASMPRRSHSISERRPTDALRGRVVEVLDQLRPMVRGDGGDIELVDFDSQGVVRIRLLGACIGCPSSGTTISLGIERNLRDQIPEVTAVVCT